MSPSSRERRWWTKEEDDILREETRIQLTENGSVKNWNDIAALLPGRTNKDCRKRWCKVRTDIRKGAWSPEEDDRLQQAVAQLGFKWAGVSKAVQTRNADQCAKRWQHVLGPGLKHGPWSADEDNTLERAIVKYGNNWKQISTSELPTRSAHDIRNRSVALRRRVRNTELGAHLSNGPHQPPTPDSNDMMTSEYPSDGEGDETDDEDNDISDRNSNSQSCTPNSDPTMDIGTHYSEMNFQVNDYMKQMWPTPVDSSKVSEWNLANPTAHAQHPFQASSSNSDRGPGSMASTNNIGTLPDFSSNDVMAGDESMFDVIGDGMFSISGDLTELGTSWNTESSASSGTQPEGRVRAAGEEKGSITVVLKQVDPKVTQEIIGNLVRHDVELTIRVVNN